MDDDDTVAREVDVELQAVGAERQAVVERRQGVFRRERATAAVCEHERSGRRKKGMSHRPGVSVLTASHQAQKDTFGDVPRQFG
jgi:hypothetical protein